MAKNISNFEIASLISRFLKGTLSAEETGRLNAWIAENEDHRAIWQKLTDPDYLENRRGRWKSADTGEAWRTLEGILAGKKKDPGRLWLKRLSVAAFWIIAVAGMGTAAWWLWHGSVYVGRKDKVLLVGENIVPRGKVATLTLGNGRQVALNGAGLDSIKAQGTTVYKMGSRLNYATAHQTAQKELLYNMITTPRGGEYQVTLADGTSVWLNAASSLRFPVHFSSGERTVYLTGEAYFEVAKDAAHPFNVVVDNLNVTVLGTRFNINAYAEGDGERVTLAEGSVRVQKETGVKTAGSVLLTPGQQAVCGPGGDDIKVRPVNVAAVLAWKDGQFLFEGETLGALMSRLARWYDVDVVYDTGVNRQMHFTGRIQKYDNISSILHLMEITGKVKFRLEGRTLEVQTAR
jgi:ferric-dicitrate binding protein FerR (iron transport regulator)